MIKGCTWGKTILELCHLAFGPFSFSLSLRFQSWRTAVIWGLLMFSDSSSGWLSILNKVHLCHLLFSHSVVTPWTAAHQTSLSITNFQRLLKLMYIKLVVPSNHLILSHPYFLLPSIFPTSGSFPMSQFLASGGQSIRISALAPVLPVNVQD